MQEQDAAVAAAVTKGTAVSKRKKEKKPLRCQTILAAAHKARPVNQAASKKSKLKGPAVKVAAKTSASALLNVEDGDSEKSSLDLWEDRFAPEIAERPSSGEDSPHLTAQGSHYSQYMKRLEDLKGPMHHFKQGQAACG